MHRSDAEAAIKKFKKSLSAVVAATILKSFDGDEGGGGGQREGGFKDGMSYDAFCDVMNGLAVAEKEKEGEGKTKESKPANSKTETSEKRQRRPSKKRKN